MRWFLLILFLTTVSILAVAQQTTKQDPETFDEGQVDVSDPRQQQEQQLEQQIQDSLANVGVNNVQLTGTGVKQTENGYEINSLISFSVNGQSFSGSNLKLEQGDDGFLYVSGSSLRTENGVMSGVVKVKTDGGKTTAEYVSTAQTETKDQQTRVEGGKNVAFSKDDKTETVSGESADRIIVQSLYNGHQMEDVRNYVVNSDGTATADYVGTYATKDQSLHGEGLSGLKISGSQMSVDHALFISTPETANYDTSHYSYAPKQKMVSFEATKNIAFTTSDGSTNINNIKGSFDFFGNRLISADIISLVDNNTISLPTPLKYAPALQTVLSAGELFKYDATNESVILHFNHHQPILLNGMQVANTGGSSVFEAWADKSGTFDNASVDVNNGLVSGKGSFRMNPGFTLHDFSLDQGYAVVDNNTFVQTKKEALSVLIDQGDADVVINQNNVTISGQTRYLLNNKLLYESYHLEILSVFMFADDLEKVEMFASKFNRTDLNFELHNGPFVVYERYDRFFDWADDADNSDIQDIQVAGYQNKDDSSIITFEQRLLHEMLGLNDLYVYSTVVPQNQKLAEIMAYQRRVIGE